MTAPARVPGRGLLLVGAGGFARETAAACDAKQGGGQRRRVLGFVDDDPGLWGRRIDGFPVLGGLEIVYQRREAAVVVCTGRPGDYASRQRIVRRLGLDLARYGTVVHPSAVLARDTMVGSGTVLLAHVVTTAAVRIGNHVAVMPATVLTHDVVVDDYATLAAGVKLSGGVRVEAGAYLGSGTLVREGISIGAGALIGMGSVVLRSIPPGEVWAGTPARRLGPAPEPVLTDLALMQGGAQG